MMNIKGSLSYDGSCYLGWQKNNAGPSIEGTLQEACEIFFQQKISLQAASRTDAGVHAKGQVINFLIKEQNVDFDHALYRLNRLLPNDIAITSLELASLDYHPTTHAIGKTYTYTICNASIQLPLLRHLQWHYSYKLDLVAMTHAAALLTGTHDFSGFCNLSSEGKNNQQKMNSIRSLSSISITKNSDEIIEIEITGNNFLYKMARNIVGFLCYTGRGIFTLNDLITIIKKKDRTLNGITAPAHGLQLTKVFY